VTLGLKFYRLLDIFPPCADLVDLQIPDIPQDWFAAFDPAGLVAAKWVNRLEKLSGSPHSINYLCGGTPFYHLESTTKVPSRSHQRLVRHLGQRLLALHLHLS